MANKKKRKASAIEPATTDTSPPAKRGRPGKAKPEQVISSPPPAATLRKRGRPKKTQQDEAASSAPNETADAPTTPFRPKKVKLKNSATRTSKRLSNGAADAANASLGLRTRPLSAKGLENGTSNGAVVAVKEAKSNGKGKVKASAKISTETTTETETIPVSSISKIAKPAKARKGRKGTKEATVEDDAQGSRSSNVSVAVPAPKDETSEDENADDEAEDDGPKYYLCKAEPNSRIEKGKDVKFSIDDLRAATEPEGWDGVRNAAARNNMRMMLKGDLAFFYHSNCKTPGIAGVMEIVQEHSADESALDPAHPYYDEKSTAENPKWCKVHVEFRQKFPKLIKLKELQKYAKDGGILHNMQTLRQSRLSVSKVSKKEWEFIMSLVDDDDEEEPFTPAPQAQMIADTAAREGIRAELKERNDAGSSRSNRAVYNGDVARPSGTKPKPNAENGNAGASYLGTDTLGTNGDSTRPSGTESKRSAENANAGTSYLGAEPTGSNGDSALPPTDGPDQKTETSSAANPATKLDTAETTDIGPASQTQDAAEHLRELADPLEHLHENIIVNTLATILPGPLAPS